MAKNNDNKKSFSIYSFLGKVADILFFPIIIISLISSVSMLAQRQKNQPTSIFGYSFVNVLSKSMTSQGFLKGDTVLTRKVEIKDVNLGDVIAFYRYSDPLDANVNAGNLTVIVKYNYTGGKDIDMSEENIVIGVDINSITKIEREGEKGVVDAQKAKASIYFHQVIGIYADDYGNIFYQTKGSENASTEIVRSDLVVGEYVNTPRFIRDIISFCSSALGMIILVCVPLSILVMFQCFSLIKQVEIMSIEKQIIQGKKRYDDPELAKQFKGSEMEIYNKAYLYYLTSPIERDQVFNYMWGDIIESKKINKKTQKELDLMSVANKKLETSDKEYWETWINGTKGFTKRKLVNYYEEVAVYNVLSTTNQKTAQANKKQEELTKQTKETLNAVIEKVEKTQQEKSSVIKEPLKKVPIKRTQTVKSVHEIISDKKVDDNKEQNKATTKIAPKIKKSQDSVNQGKETQKETVKPIKKVPKVKTVKARETIMDVQMLDNKPKSEVEKRVPANSIKKSTAVKAVKGKSVSQTKKEENKTETNLKTGKKQTLKQTIAKTKATTAKKNEAKLPKKSATKINAVSAKSKKQTEN